MNRVTLIGRVRAPAVRRFTLAAGGVEVPVESDRVPAPDARVAIEGVLRSRDGSLYVQATALDVLPEHMV